MKVVNSLKSCKKRDKDCQVVKRRGRIYVINKKKPKIKSTPRVCKNAKIKIWIINFL